jgi:hypothetical protein
MVTEMPCAAVSAAASAPGCARRNRFRPLLPPLCSRILQLTLIDMG